MGLPLLDRDDNNVRLPRLQHMARGELAQDKDEAGAMGGTPPLPTVTHMDQRTEEGTPP